MKNKLPRFRDALTFSVLSKPDGAVVWLPRGKDNYYVVTCTNCLRSFPVRSKTEDRHSERLVSWREHIRV